MLDDHRRVHAAEPGATDLAVAAPELLHALAERHARHTRCATDSAARGRQSRGLPNDDGTLEHRSASTASTIREMNRRYPTQ